MLDEQAWGELAEQLYQLVARAGELQDEAAKRLKSSGGDEVPTTLVIAAFQSAS